MSQTYQRLPLCKLRPSGLSMSGQLKELRNCTLPINTVILLTCSLGTCWDMTSRKGLGYLGHNGWSEHKARFMFKGLN